MATTIEHAVSLWPSRALVTFVQRQVNHADPYPHSDRRSEPRSMLVMPVIVQAVDEQLATLGEAQAMVIRDYSRSGLGLVHEQPFPFERLVMRLTYPEEGTLLAAEVRWHKALGPFYHLGCEVVAKLDRFAPFDHIS